jgi:hypothetical protein
LPEFIQYLNSIGYPKFLQGKSNRNWELYLKELIRNMKEFLDQVHGYALGIYIGIHVLGAIFWSGKGTNTKTKSTMTTTHSFGFVIRLLVGHGIIAGLAFASYKAIGTYSYLAQCIESGAIFEKAFPTNSTTPFFAKAVPKYWHEPTKRQCARPIGPQYWHDREQYPPPTILGRH